MVVFFTHTPHIYIPIYGNGMVHIYDRSIDLDGVLSDYISSIQQFKHVMCISGVYQY